jgi:ribosomal protein S18 acetylase RimI-like enzyme
MSKSIEFELNKASESVIAEHLLYSDTYFIPPLSERVEIRDYAKKIASKAMRFEAWSGGNLAGMVASYCGDQETLTTYITSVSVLQPWMGKGIATKLMKQCIEHAKMSGMKQVSLKVSSTNTSAIRLYEKCGFISGSASMTFVTMNLYLNSENSMSKRRDYNIELNDTSYHKYAYEFDFNVMHPYMIKSFEPFFNKGSLLELGSFKGDFTRRFLPYFDEITCVEASNKAVEEAKNKLGDKVQFITALFENVNLPRQYENIVLTHVLEHLNDPVMVLKRINDEWLTEDGRFFLVCPNANAPSRQIAVKMGLISHNAAVTSAEAEHGHLCTYTLDTLERDAVAAGLKVVHRSGIFFKALANFQWDRLLQTDIISKEYLDGCYKLGQQYPDLCSSIFLVCERGYDI